MIEVLKPLTEEEFYSLPENERRVRLAKDVLALMESGKLEPSSGIYMNLPTTKWIVDQQDLRQMEKTCYACALGALTLAKIHNYNQGKISTIPTNASIVDALREFFSREQLALIELAFEGYTVVRDHSATNEQMGRAVKYQSLDRDDRFTTIMQNIIDNDGEFKP